MNLKPAFNYLHLRIHVEVKSSIVLPEQSGSLTETDDKVSTEVIGLGPDVKCCAIGDTILTRADSMRNFIKTNDDPIEGLIHDSAVLAVIVKDEDVALLS